MLANRYGHFDDTGRTFRITDPATPMPWVNVVSNGRYGFVVSQNGGGFSWYDDAQHCVLTRWEMDLVRDCSGKFLYLSDRESGDVWSVAPTPCRPEYDSYQCEHTQGSTRFRTSAHGIESTWTLTVAPEDPVEVWLVTLKNTTTRDRKLRIASYFEWTCGVAPDAKREFHRLFFTTTHDARRRAVIAVKNMWDIPPKGEKQHWNQPWPYVAAHAVSGITFERDLALADKSSFLGRYGQTHNPKAMRGEPPTNGRFGRFGDAAAALGGDLTLKPGETAELHFLLAIGHDHAQCLANLDKYLPQQQARQAAQQASAKWESLLSPTSVKTDRDDFNILNNTWLPYQAISARLWGRTGYYQQSGAFGFRDQLQDTHVWLPIEPKRCLDHILYAATRQFEDGSVNHWWHALADFGNHTACSDDYLWLPMLVSSYLKETGDASLLQKRIPFRNGGFRAPRAGEPTDGTLMEHCLRSFKRAFGRLSERGLPHIGSCDWNDGLSAMGVEERGESVWLGWFLCELLRDWAVILDRAGDVATAGDFRKRREKMISDINAAAWDGAWFRYGTKDNGEWVGSARSAEGKIHLNAQTWAIIADGTTPDRTEAAWSSVKQRLLSAYGPLLLEPAYTVPDATIGYITRYSPGSRENGGVYMHAATWALLAACKLKDVESVGRIWASIAPPSRCGADAEAYWAEPYVLPGNVDGPLSELPGRAGWTWYSGSAAWLNKVSLEWVLGVRPTLAGLLIDPCPARELGRVSMARNYRGRRLKLKLDATNWQAGVGSVVTVNGREIPGGLIDDSVLAGVAEGTELAIEVYQRLGAQTKVAGGTAAVRRSTGE